MYIISLTYHQPLEHVDALLEAHIAWLKHYFATGDFLAAGRKEPRTGGVILAKNQPRSQLDAILSEDPFQAVAHYDVIQANMTNASEAFSALKGV